MNMKHTFTSRRFKYGALSTAITILVVFMLVVVNVVASLLTDKFPLTIDLTPNSAFKLTQESIDFVKGLDKPVEITVLANEKTLESGGDIYTSQIKSVIDQYAQYNSNISVQYVDIVSDPTFASQYENLNLGYNDVLIVCGDKSRKISLVDMFNITTNQYTGAQTITSSKAEEMMTSAIMGVTSDEVVKIGILTGHEEMDFPALRELLAQNNFEVVDVNLTSDEIDPTIDVLFMLAPSRDPDEALIKKLDTFLRNGEQYGKTFFYAANAETQNAMPNLDAFLADWGIQVGEGSVLETNAANIFNYNPYFCTVEYKNFEDYMEDIDSSIRVSMPYGRPVNTLFENQSGYTTTTLLSYSDTALTIPNGVDPQEALQTVEPQSVPALVRSSYLRYEGTTPLSSNVFVCSAASSFENVVLNSKSVANADYYLNLLNTVTEREDVISIAPKALGGEELGINQLQAMVIAFVLVIVLPLVVLITGIVIWLRRRHR